ncbi:MAG TPA: hypothetical protein PLJ47_14905 [Candidatus Hydrogenedentes bacterium]|nr:hypothetical protein [Candidatus Hydrogenedentota bacterium]HRK35884.1 hypothetical protein [Candidatus Hydrogenedentota bacterium]
MPFARRDVARPAQAYPWILLALTWAVVSSAQEASPEKLWLQLPSVSGAMSFESAYGTAERALQKLRLELVLELKGSLSETTDYTIIGRLRADPVFENGHVDGTDFPDVSEATRPLRIGETAELELREAYVRSTWDDWHFTLGKQQIVWGLADGLKVIDVVNPQDLREFILVDFENSRIPLWAVNAERPIGDWNLQLVWVPDKSYYMLPRVDSEFELTAGVPPVPPGFHLEFESPDRPSRFFADSDAGLRLSTFKSGWDITFNYLYHYDDVPTFSRKFGLTAEGPAVRVQPEYARSHLFGGTASKAFGDFTLRLEYGLFLDKHFPTGSLLDRDGVVEGTNLSYMIGLDWFGIENTVVSFQVFQDWFSNDAEGLARDEMQTYTTLALQRRFIRDTLMVESIWFQDLNHGDGLIRPKITYAVNDALSVYAGVDYFYGSEKGFFGQFDAKDRVYGGLTWRF